MLTIQQVNEAAERIRGLVHRTPIATSDRLDEIAGATLFFKCENLQKAGAFKARGATNAVFALAAEDLSNGVATHSSGNHGAALARAAQLRGIPSNIVVPANAKRVKREAIVQYGGRVILSESTLAAREAKLIEVIKESGAQVIHPYDNDFVIAGQGTAVQEMLIDTAGLDALVVPVGGGGLLAGSALVAKQAGIPIYGVEPEGADDASRSFHSGVLIKTHTPNTICDGLLTTLGEKNFDIIQSNVQDILLVNDAETIQAMELIWTRTKMMVEPSSAVTLAAVLRYQDLFRGKRIGLVLSGGNVDLADLPF